MAIALDTTSNGTAGASVTSLTHAYTCTGSNLALVVVVAWQSDTNDTMSGCTYNGVAMTAVVNFRESIFNNQGLALFVLANPSTGSHDIVATFGFTAPTAALVASSWTGVDQTTPSRSGFTASVDANLSTSPDLAVTNAQSGDVVVDGFHKGGGTNPTSNQTIRANSGDIAGNGETLSHASADATGSTTMAYTVGTEQIGALGGFALIPASGGGGGETITMDKWSNRSAELIARRIVGMVASGTMSIKN